MHVKGQEVDLLVAQSEHGHLRAGNDFGRIAEVLGHRPFGRPAERLEELRGDDALTAGFSLDGARLLIARRYGFDNWNALVNAVPAAGAPDAILEIHRRFCELLPEELLWKDTPEDRVGDYEYLIEVLDWELNVDPDMQKNRFMDPIPVKPLEEMESEGYIDKWVCYKSDVYSAKELTILPGASVMVKDAAAYGLIMMQGHGKLGIWDIETPALIRFGQLTHDEYFVSEKAATEGVRIVNPSKTDPIVMLKHFGPENPELKI